MLYTPIRRVIIIPVKNIVTNNFHSGAFYAALGVK
jgi:hypothetical protein